MVDKSNERVWGGSSFVFEEGIEDMRERKMIGRTEVREERRS
jgi:hypothetical protein